MRDSRFVQVLKQEQPLVEQVNVLFLREYLLTAIPHLIKTCTVLVVTSVGCGARNHTY